MKIAIIIPYFGHFDKLFPIWLHSCSYNTFVDWILFTDDRRTFNYPHNVKVHYMSFEQMQEHIQKFYDFDINLANPYRLCNFKPAYGEIFEDYIKEYDAWGYCDNDMIYGKIPTPESLCMTSKYKIGRFGHFSYIENTKESRTIYRYRDIYKTVFSTDRPLFFDEGLFQQILWKHGYIEKEIKIADFMPRLFQHEILNEPGREWINEYHCFVWNNGKLLRYYKDKNGTIVNEEYSYVHFLKRPMSVAQELDLSRPLVIIPNSIYNIGIEDITPEFLRQVSRPRIFWKYWKNSLKPKNFIDRFLNRLYRNKKDRELIEELSLRVGKP